MKLTYMKKLIILAIAALCFASCGNAAVVNNERQQALQTFVEQSFTAEHIGWVMGHSK